MSADQAQMMSLRVESGGVATWRGRISDVAPTRCLSCGKEQSGPVFDCIRRLTTMTFCRHESREVLVGMPA